MSNQKDPTECCPKFNPAFWDGKIFNWNNKKFIKDKVFTFFYMPINFGQVITRMMKKITSAKAECLDMICLSEHSSKWSMNIYLAVNKKITDAKNIMLSGTYLSKVYEGPFQDTSKWCKDYEEYTKSKKLKIKKWYMWYTTCPKCAKKYGKNYVVIFAEIEN